MQYIIYMQELSIKLNQFRFSHQGARYSETVNSENIILLITWALKKLKIGECTTTMFLAIFDIIMPLSHAFHQNLCYWCAWETSHKIFITLVLLIYYSYTSLLLLEPKYKNLNKFSFYSIKKVGQVIFLDNCNILYFRSETNFLIYSNLLYMILTWDNEQKRLLIIFEL